MLPNKILWFVSPNETYLNSLSTSFSAYLLRIDETLRLSSRRKLLASWTSLLFTCAPCRLLPVAVCRLFFFILYQTISQHKIPSKLACVVGTTRLNSPSTDKVLYALLMGTNNPDVGLVVAKSVFLGKHPLRT